MLLSLLTAGPQLSERPLYPTGTPQFAPEPLSDDTGGALADATTSRLKAWFVSTLGKKDDNGALADLEKRIDHLAASKKLSRKEADSLLKALRSPKLAHELATRK
jgi:hypothetical protein